MTRKARVEGAAADPAPKATLEHDALTTIVEQFKREHADEWDACRLWPTQSGITHMIEVLSR